MVMSVCVMRFTVLEVTIKQSNLLCDDDGGDEQR